MSLAVVGDLREVRSPAGPDELGAFKTDVLAGSCWPGRRLGWLMPRSAYFLFLEIRHKIDQPGITCSGRAVPAARPWQAAASRSSYPGAE